VGNKAHLERDSAVQAHTRFALLCDQHPGRYQEGPTPHAPASDCALITRLFATRIELFHGTERVASHARQFGRNARVIVPEHFEPVFAHKPRARVMVYCDWLVGLSVVAADYVSQVCRKRYAEMDTQDGCVVPTRAVAWAGGLSGRVGAGARAADLWCRICPDARDPTATRAPTNQRYRHPRAFVPSK